MYSLTPDPGLSDPTVSLTKDLLPETKSEVLFLFTSQAKLSLLLPVLCSLLSFDLPALQVVPRAAFSSGARAG